MTTTPILPDAPTAATWRTIPVYSQSANYYEWEITVPTGTFCIVDDAGAWCLLKHVGTRHSPDWVEVGESMAVGLFLSHYRCTLASA